MRETAEQRSRVMRAVKSADTGPELAVRRLAHHMGYRFRLHRDDLPGKPDMVFVGLRKIIFIHGCFWHGHECKRGNRIPTNNREYWLRKIGRNRERDRAASAALEKLGWEVKILWECEIADHGAILKDLRRFLDRPKRRDTLDLVK